MNLTNEQKKQAFYLSMNKVAEKYVEFLKKHGFDANTPRETIEAMVKDTQPTLAKKTVELWNLVLEGN